MYRTNRKGAAITAVRHLWVIRHAKTANPVGVRDFDRPLADRGHSDAALLQRWLAEQSEAATFILTSPALRARQTAEFVQAAFAVDDKAVVDVEELYLADPEDVLDAVRAVPANFTSVAVIGHNPGLTYFCNLLAGREVVESLPTFGVVRFRLSGEWSELGFGRHEPVEVQTPKRLKPSQ